MRIELSDDPTVFRRRDWTDLVWADPWGTFFHTPAYLKLWWEEFGTGSLAIALALEGDDVVGACCFEVVDGALTFLGGFDVTDYMGPVSAPGREESMAKELVAGLSDGLQWTSADLRGLPEGSPWIRALSAAAADRGLDVQCGEDGVAPRLTLPGEFDEYLSALPSKLRHEIRRKERRLRQEAGEYGVVASTAETLPQDMDRFLELHRQSPGPKGRFMHAGMEIFFRRLGEAFLPSHVFHLVFLELASGEKVAGAIGFAHRDSFLLYNSAFDRGFAPLAPGMVLVADLIRLSIEAERSSFDFLKGDLDYKYRFGPTPRPVQKLLVRR